MSLSPEQFGKSLIKAGLFSAKEVKAIWSSVLSGNRPKEGESFAQLLVERGELTSFQARRLLSGQGDSLVLGDYVLLNVLGTGGMGQVFQARHRRMKRLVALKLLPPALSRDENTIRRFEREVEAAARLTHSNIVIAYDAGKDGEWHFLVMEYVDGLDLASHVKKYGTLPLAQAIHCIRQAAKGLKYAHEQGIVHRDIKPANLLLDRKRNVKILDMGLARLDSAGLRQDELTGTGQVMGTVDYMAPEQAVNTKQADARSDIYSLGMTFWYLLAGRAAYAGNSLVEKLLAHQSQPVPSLAAACPDAPAELQAIFAKMVAKNPTDRFQSMEQVITALAGIDTRSQLSETIQFSTTSVPTSASSPNDIVDSGGASAAAPQPSPDAAIQVAADPATTPLEETLVTQQATIGTEPYTNLSLSLPSAISTLKTKGPRTQPDKPWWRHPGPLVALASVAVLLVACGVWVIVRDKQGKEVGRTKVPQGGKVEISQQKSDGSSGTERLLRTASISTPLATTSRSDGGQSRSLPKPKLPPKRRARPRASSSSI